MNDLSTTHLSDEDIVRYRSRRMQPAELLTADDHFALCDSCYARMSEGQGGREVRMAASRAFNEAVNCEITHLEYEQLAALVDDQLSEIDREIVESHLEMCSQCEAELNDLREFSSRMAASRPLEPEGARRSSFRAAFIALWRVPSFRIPTQALAAVAAITLLAFLVSIPVRKENAELRARLAELERSNAEQTTAAESAQNEVAALRSENERLKQTATGQDQVLVALNDGGSRVTLDRQGNLSGAQTDLRYEQAIKETLRNERVKFPAAIREIRSQSGTLMGGPQNEFKVLFPVGVVIETQLPTFRWTAVEGASNYTVTVYDSSLNKVTASDAVTGTQWTSASPLARGRVYVWQVRATKDGQQIVAPPPAAGRAKFKVLEQSKIEEIERFKRSGSKSHLVLGLMYADAGLLTESEQEFAALVRENPDSSTARKLLQSVRAARR